MDAVVGLPPAGSDGDDHFLKEGKPSRRDDPGPVRHALTKAQRDGIAERKAAAAARDAKLDEAGALAARELKAAQVGVVRATLFDADDWKREHAARQGRMEQTFSRLYKPQAGEYWTKKAKPPPRKPPPAQLPAYTNVLPTALSLAHPSSRELPSDDEEEDEAPPPAAAQSAQADFDPMAEPRRFYAEFKGRVAALKVGVKDNPTDRPTQAALQPRAADELIAAATRRSPPPVPPPPQDKVDPPSWSVQGNIVSLTTTNPILDEDFDVEPSLVYTDSAHYCDSQRHRSRPPPCQVSPVLTQRLPRVWAVADHGVNIPMWDELDAELAALDVAHESAMKALAIRADAPPQVPAAQRERPADALPADRFAPGSI